MQLHSKCTYYRVDRRNSRRKQQKIASISVDGVHGKRLQDPQEHHPMLASECALYPGICALTPTKAQHDADHTGRVITFLFMACGHQ